MPILTYRGLIVGSATDKVRLTPRLAAAPVTDPERRVALLMGAYALKLREEGAGDEYTDDDAAQVAEDTMRAEGAELPAAREPAGD